MTTSRWTSARDAAPGVPRLVTQPVKAHILELAEATPDATFRYYLHEPARTVLLARVPSTCPATDGAQSATSRSTCRK